MAYFYRLICFIFFLSFSFNSKAYVLNIDPGANLYPRIYQNCKGNIDYGDVKSSLLGSGEFWVAYREGMNAGGNCMEAYGFSCPIGTDTITVDRYGARCVIKNICPENSSKQGGYCVCNDGYQENNGRSCEIKPPDPCEDLNAFCASQFMKETSWETSGKSRPASVCSTPKMQVVGGSGGFTSRFPGCSRGCSIETYPGIVSSQDPFDDSWKVSGDGKYNGQSCNADSSTVTPEEPKPEEPKPEDKAPCKSGEFSGNVNGVDVCIPSKSKSNDGSKTTVNNSDGSSSEITKVTVCSNGFCNTTITKIDKDSSGSNTGTSTRTITETEDEFCQKNPANSLCKKDKGTGDGSGSGAGEGEGDDEGKGSSFGGSCSSGFTCEGDAIQCAIAKNQHELACSFTADTSSAEYGAYQQAKGADGVQRGEDSSVSIADAISTDSLIGAGSCLSDLSVDFMGGAFSIPLSSLCPYFEMLGYLLVAVGMVMAIRIIGGA